MATHQSISGTTDEEFVQRMVTSYAERFGESFWTLFETAVDPALPPYPVMVDLGCGPGLFLRDLATRYPHATLYGYDVTPAMIAYGKQLVWPGTVPTFAVYDVSTQPLPLVTGSVHLLSMMSVLHLFDDPLQVLAEVKRVLAASGIFLLRDWVRSPLKDYLARRQPNRNEEPELSRLRGFRLFPVHNKYTLEDWQWLLGQAGFIIRSISQLRPTHRIFITTPDRN